jgi:hypothetical protein
MTQDRCTVWLNIARKTFWTHLIVLLGDEAQVDACFGLLEIVLILTQDWFLVCSNVPQARK